MSIRPLIALVAAMLWITSCGFEEEDFEVDIDSEDEDDVEVTADDDIDPEDEDEDDVDVEVTVDVEPGGQSSPTEAEGEPTPDENAEPSYDLQCAGEADICRFCGPAGEVVTDCSAGDSRFECQVFELVNEKRVDHGLAPLGYDATLAESAKIHTMDLNHCDYFAHDSQDGTTFFERCAENGYAGTCTGENIGGGQQTPRAVMDAWMESPGHRDNILYDNHTHMGVAYYEGDGAYGRYWVKHFGRE